MSVERETFPRLLRDGRLMVGHRTDGYWTDVGTPAALVLASSDLVRGAGPLACAAGTARGAAGTPDRRGARRCAGRRRLGGRRRLRGRRRRRRRRQHPDGRRSGGARRDRRAVGARTRRRRGPGLRRARFGARRRRRLGARCELRDGVRIGCDVQIPDDGAFAPADPAATPPSGSGELAGGYSSMNAPRPRRWAASQYCQTPMPLALAGVLALERPNASCATCAPSGNGSPSSAVHGAAMNLFAL